jgi:hypothetical protein
MDDARRRRQWTTRRVSSSESVRRTRLLASLARRSVESSARARGERLNRFNRSARAGERPATVVMATTHATTTTSDAGASAARSVYGTIAGEGIGRRRVGVDAKASAYEVVDGEGARTSRL